MNFVDYPSARSVHVDPHGSIHESHRNVANDDQDLINLIGIIASFTGTQLKSLLKSIKSLRSIDGESVFEDTSLTGKKGEIFVRIKNIITMIYSGEIVITPQRNRNYWSCFDEDISYKETIDFTGWKLEIQGFVQMISSQSRNRSKRSKKENCSVMNASLFSRLSACDKQQIIGTLERLLNEQKDGKLLAKRFEDLLPKPSLERIFQRHSVLIKAISKAQPWTKYGSSRDDYCFRRCRSAINTAKKAIIEDGKQLIQCQDWDTCLEYLVVEMGNIKQFPQWDNDSNNSAVRDLQKKLRVWHGKVKKGLSGEMSKVQQQRMDVVTAYLSQVRQ